jgi:MraZ protein
MLLGTWEVNSDERGRLTLPPPFVAAVAAGLTVTRGFDRCLHAFPRSAWDALALRVGALPIGAEPARHMRRLLFGAAADLALDDGAGLVLPRHLLSYAEITGPVVLIGMDTYFEIWSPEAWRAADDQLVVTLGRWRAAELPAPLSAI